MMLGMLTTRLLCGNHYRYAISSFSHKVQNANLSYLTKHNNVKPLITRKTLQFGQNLSRKTETLAESSIAYKTNSTAKKVVGTWLLGCSGMVFGAVVLGGITRLTESGLSMVTWKLLGEKMPRTQEQWENEFNKYKQFPEFQMQNAQMTLQEFKRIWWFEYAHRTWGRCIGGFFLLPATFFWLKGWLHPAMKKRVVIFGALIAAQGLMGWYMVKSGLEKERFQNPSDVVRVSQYRLASHLGLAVALYSGFLWSALHHLLPAEKLATIPKGARSFRMLALSCKGFAFSTAVLGAFVAGLDAGLVYNSFPKMGDNWIPKEILSYEPLLSNFTENPAMVQFEHRLLGITTLSLISGVWLLSRRRQLPPRAYKAANALMAMGWIQVTLGVTTLLHFVPISLAALHQSGSLVLMSCAIWLAHEIKYLKRVAK